MDRTHEASTSGIPSSEDVVNCLKQNNELERLRMQAIERLEQDGELRRTIEDAIKNSYSFRHFSGDKLKSLHGQLYSELGADLSLEALRALWRVLSDEETGISQQIDEAARAALCQLHAKQQQPAEQPPA